MIDDPLIGCQLANFRIERPLGRGGMAQVYYGVDVKLNRPVALKVIDARYRGNPAYARRFVHEAQAIARWRHEHIVQIYYADDQDGLYYYVMEYIDGLDLASLLADYSARSELLPQAEVLRIGAAVASALDYAHQRGVIHRDVKPSNVMLARDGRVVMTDFGLAMDVEQGSLGEVAGSPRYAAPEQARHSANAVPQSDLYALGVMLYEMLAGQVPFDDPSSTAVALQHLTLPPPPPREINPDLNEATETVLLKALSKSPADRYPTGRELIEALAAALPAVPVAAVPPPPTRPDPLQLPAVDVPSPTNPLPGSAAAPSSPARRNRLGLAGAGLGAVLLLGAMCAILLAFLFSRGTGDTTAAASPTPASTTGATGSEPAPTGSPTPPPATPTPAQVAAPATPAGPAGYKLLLARRGEDNLVVLNQASNPLPLSLLSLGDAGQGGITGGDWASVTLNPEECVVVWWQKEDKVKGKGKGNDKKDDKGPDSEKASLPDGITCRRIAAHLTRQGGEPFWKHNFSVDYNQTVSACSWEGDQCTVTLPGQPVGTQE